MTKITIETTIDGSEDTQKVVVESSKTCVLAENMLELVCQALRGLGYHISQITEWEK